METSLKTKEFIFLEQTKMFQGMFEEDKILTLEDYYEKELDLKNNKKTRPCSLYEDADSFLKSTIGHKDVVLNEKWDFTQNIQGKIIDIKINAGHVSVDCLINKEERIFQYRVFPYSLFNGVENLSVNMNIIIKIRSKSQSMRIDIYPGEGLVDDSLFTQKENWESLSDSKLDEKLTKW